MRLIWDTGRQFQQLRVEVKELQDSTQETYEFMQALATQNKLLCKDSEMLRAALQHERELRERDLRELKLELRLQISEELRRLPPSEGE